MTLYCLDIREFQVTLTSQPSLSGIPLQLFGEPFNQLFPDSNIDRRQPLL